MSHDLASHRLEGLRTMLDTSIGAGIENGVSIPVDQATGECI